MAVLAQQHPVLSEPSPSFVTLLLLSIVCLRCFKSWTQHTFLLVTVVNSPKVGLLCRLAMTRSSDMLCTSAMLMLWLSSWSRHMRRQAV